MKSIFFILTFIVLTACTSSKTYENTAFPKSDSPWHPINPENFNKSEAQRLLEGQQGK